MTQVCVIFGAGEYYAGTPVVPAGAYENAADGGLDHTRQLGIVPDVVVGDFDSLEGRPPRTEVRPIALPALKGGPACWTIRTCSPGGRSGGRRVAANSMSMAVWAAALTIRFPAFN